MKPIKQRLMEVPKVSDETMKIFSYKGAAMLALICVIATSGVPALFNLIGIHSKIVTVLSTSILGSFGICYVRNFVDSKKGMSKGVIYQFLIFFVAFFIISYYWLYYQYYI